MWTPQEFPARAILTPRNDRVRRLLSITRSFVNSKAPTGHPKASRLPSLPARFKTALFAMSREIIIAPLLDNDGALVAPAAPEQLQLSTGPYAKSVGAVLCSKLVIASTLFNAAGCVSACTLVFWLLFGVLSQGPYPWYSPNLVGVVVGSSLIACPALCMALAPAGMPEALQNGWFFCLRVEDCPPWLLYAFPYLQANRCTRIGLGRH